MKYPLAILLTLFSLNTYAALTKWVDAEGVVHYSDKPPPADVKSETLRVRDRPPSEAAPEPAPEAASGVAAPKKPMNIYEREAARKKARKEQEEKDKKAAKLEEQKRLNAQNCAMARDQLNTMKNAPMVAGYDANGERTILDDTARQARIEQAQAAVNKYCNQ